MAILRRTQFIRAPIERVFGTISSGGSFAEWNPTIRASRRLGDGPVGNGTRFEWELRGFDSPRQVRIVPRMRQLKGGHRFKLTADGGRTRVDHELEMSPTGAFRMFAPMMGIPGRKNLQDTASALQAHLER
jgi:uncharacterized protein YndB with AHSA1/START domain